VFTSFIAMLLKLPFLKLIGGLALLWVAIKLVAPQPHDAEDTSEAIEDQWRVARIVVVANIVMSLDNVIAVAAAAKGDYVLLGLGLAVSIPVVIAGSALFLAIVERFPIVVWTDGALLGWIAGACCRRIRPSLNIFRARRRSLWTTATLFSAVPSNSG
jgi:YjbE family integral membrane protein